ncbi:MAG TPA: 1,4-dihydroxy-2-naphthoate polyprenyltransferase [Thermoanaerobaculia bacterium]|nr:1,4-dihydroxy-2-naphthoate polyprenyltransferase [Thermoanaerobaculia bacterium]
MNAWLLAARPKTLSAAVVPVLIGATLAYPSMIWWVFACALFGAVFIQIATNFINDALDFKKGADTSERLGPLRVTQAGLLSADTVMRGAYVCLVLAAACGVPLILRGGWPMLAIGLTSMIAAYLYTGGPYPLAYHGLGELFVLIFFGFVAVGGTFYVLTLHLIRDALIAGFAAGSLAIVLLAINNLRDVETDTRSAKKTLAVRFGLRFARIEIAFCALAPFVAAVMLGYLWTLLALPLALLVMQRVFTSTGAALNRSLAIAGALQWAFGILWVCGFIATR